MSLFAHGPVRLHSGRSSDFKIECDALDEVDWEVLGRLGAHLIGRFSVPVGVPRGGLHLAAALKPYATGSPDDPVLICDDVWTTGDSMRSLREVLALEPPGRVTCLVAFSRGPLDPGVRAIFELHQLLWRV